MSPSAAERLRKAQAWLAASWSDVLFVLLGAGLFAWIADDAFGARVVTLSPGADYWEHSAALRALLDNPWHPSNSFLASPIPSPRYVPSFILAALIGRAFKLDALGAMGVVSCINLALLLTGIFWFFRSYFRDRRASLYGLVVMFASWYDAWHFSNVYQIKILFSTVSYPSTAALGLSLIGFSVTLRAVRSTAERVEWGWLGACAAVLALVMITHPLTAMLGFAGATLIAATDPGIPWRQRLRVGGAIALGGLLSFAWPYFPMAGVLRSGSHDEMSGVLPQLAGVSEEATGRLHQFYRQKGLVNSLGLALLGAPIALYLIARRRHWFISLGALAMLLPFIVNLWVPLPLGHRFILLAVFFLQTAVVWLLLKATPGAPEAFTPITTGYRGYVSSALVGLVLAACALTNVDAARAHLAGAERRLRNGESPHVRQARWIADLTGPNAVVLADAKVSWTLPTFGTKVLLLFHPNPLLRDEGARQEAVGAFLSGATTDAEREETLRHYGVTHVLLNDRQQRRVGAFLSTRAQRKNLGRLALYTLDNPQRAR